MQVDWVGLSLYHYGPKHPWVENSIPSPGKAESIMLGTYGEFISRFNFYQMFSGNGQGGMPAPASAGGKPMLITETAATIHTYVRDPKSRAPPSTPTGQSPAERAAIKQAWWRQILNATFLQRYPKIKAVNFFEFYKFEETTFRDFTIFGGDGNLGSPGNPNDGTPMNGPTLEALRRDLEGDLGKLILWGAPGQMGQLVFDYLKKLEADKATAMATPTPTGRRSSSSKPMALLSFLFSLIIVFI